MAVTTFLENRFLYFNIPDTTNMEIISDHCQIRLVAKPKVHVPDVPMPTDTSCYPE